MSIESWAEAIESIDLSVKALKEPYSFPKVKFADTNTPEEQIQHIYSEMVEFMREYSNGKKGLLDEELMDCWHSIETYFRIRQRQGIDVHAVHAAVIAKNKSRGYYVD